MSNLINNILTNENVATPNATTTPEQTVKDKPSLFDSLLSTNTPVEETKVTSDVKQEVKTEKTIVPNSEEVKVEDSEVNKEQLDVIKKVEETKELDTQGQKTTGTSSLLDRLILEAKNNNKETVNVDEKKSDNLNKNIDTSIELVKQEIKIEKAVSVDSEKTKTTDKEKEIINVDEKKSNNLNKNIDNSIELTKQEIKIKEAVTVDSEVVKNEVDTQNKKVSETSSLLDRLILEAKNSNKEVVTKDGEKIVITNSEVISSGTLNDKLSSDPLLVNNIPNENTKVTIDVKQEIKTEEIIETNPKEIKVENIATNSLLEEINTNAEVIISETSINNKEVNLQKIELVNKEVEVKEINKIISDNNQVEKEVKTVMLGDDLLIKSDKKIVTNAVENTLIETKIDSNMPLLEESETVNLKINSQAILPSEVIEKTDVDVLEKTDVKKDVKISLMDQLIQKNSDKLTINPINEITDGITTPLKDGVSKDLISNIYLGSQKNKINNQTLFNRNEAISLLKDGSSIQTVKTSAEMLDLGLQSVNVEQDISLDNIDLKKSNVDILNRKNLIDNLLLKNDIRGEEVKDLITKSVEASNALIDNTLTVADDAVVNVNSPLSYNIQSRIIGAKQQMSAMMSDIAKQMYENYKPPVTTFKINLNPLDLGSIAILMKNDKNNGLTISMNVSNNVTLETLIENQNVLKNSLSKTFDENTKFNLDFSSSNQNNNQSSNNGQGNNRQFEQQMDTKSILELQEENKDREEKVIDYM